MSQFQVNGKDLEVASKSERQIAGAAECSNCEKLQQDKMDLLDNLDAVWNNLQEYVEGGYK